VAEIYAYDVHNVQIYPQGTSEEIVMPFYDLKCEVCKKEVEVYVSTPDDKPELCEDCGGTLKHVYTSAPGIVFKGKGFYSTDK
jgi:putative FmdB family regulatory protein